MAYRHIGSDSKPNGFVNPVYGVGTQPEGKSLPIAKFAGNGAANHVVSLHFVSRIPAPEGQSWLAPLATHGEYCRGKQREQVFQQRQRTITGEGVTGADRPGDRIRAYIYDVRREPRGPQIFLTRTRPELMKALFAQEVPEIYDGIIEIRAAARDPGSRAKIAVISKDTSIDPVGACVGMRGSRVQAVVGELQGEKIDIIPWSPDPATFVVNALAPAEVTKVVLDEDANKIEVVVPDEQLSLAIGRRGQNVRLASMLSGWDIDILTEEEESKRRQDEFNTRSAMYIEALDVEDVIAHLLVTEGFTTVEEVAFVPMEDLLVIEGFDEDIGEELQARARNWLEERDAKLDVERKKLGVEDAMLNVAGVSLETAVRLGGQGVRTAEDLAGLMPDEYRFIFMDILVKWIRLKKFLQNII